MPSLDDVQYVSFASAGTRGICYLGVLDALEDELLACGKSFDEWRTNLRGVSGTSAGAIAALVVLLGLDRQMRDEILDTLTDTQTHIRPDIALLMKHFGWEDGKGLRRVISWILNRGGLSAESTLQDVKRLLKQELVCICTDLRTGKAVELSCTQTPNVKVVDAIFASACVPFVFTPPKIEGYMLTDGCLACEQPNVFPEEATLFVRMTKDLPDDLEISSWSAFMGAVVRCAVIAQSHTVDRLLSMYRDHVMLIHPLGDVIHMPSFDVNQDTDDARKLHTAGYASALHHMRDRDLFHRVGSATMVVVQRLFKAVSESPPDGESHCEENPRTQTFP